MGLDSRRVTPELTRVVVHLAAEIRSFERVEIVTEKVLSQKVSRSTVRRLAQQVGNELAQVYREPSQAPEKEIPKPEMGVVSCDGGRIRTRQAGGGRGVRLSGEKGWRETKNASFERMKPPEDSPFEEDPCPELPSSFRTAPQVARIVEKPAPEVPSGPSENAEHASVVVEGPVVYRGPKRMLRTAVSSMACSDDFGPMMRQEAERRRLPEAPRRAFLGDGLAWNWSIWRKHFRSFVPILDFIHAIQYVFSAAMCVSPSESRGWELYVTWITWCWQGRVGDVLQALQTACQTGGIPLGETLADDHPGKAASDAYRYLTNNRRRMHYAYYRRQGFPVTSAPMESLIKQMNLRVKGTEMFWDDPEGAESILHLRAATLSEDNRLEDYLAQRPGWQFTRRSSELATAA